MENKRHSIDTAQIYPDPADQSLLKNKQPIAAPTAMAELEIMKAEDAKSVANKSPEIRSIALLLMVALGVTLFSQVVTYFIVQSFGEAKASFISVFMSSNGFLGVTLLLVQAVAMFALLFTRNISHAKTIILVTGLSFGVTLVRGFFSFQIGPAVMANATTLVVDFLILRKIIKVYLEL